MTNVQRDKKIEQFPRQEVERLDREDTIKMILRGRLTLPEMALVEGYMNKEIDEFNKAATERNTLRVEVQDLVLKLANKERIAENYGLWLKECYANVECKRVEILALEAEVTRLKVEAPKRGKEFCDEVARKEKVIQYMLAKAREFRKGVNEQLHASESKVHMLEERGKTLEDVRVRGWHACHGDWCREQAKKAQP